MKDLKVSYIWGHNNFKELLIPKIITNYFNFNIIWTDPSDCDLLLIGPYKKFGKILKKIYSKSNFLSGDVFNNLVRRVFFREINQLHFFTLEKMNAVHLKKLTIQSVPILIMKKMRTT